VNQPEQREQFLRHLTKVVAGAVKQCRDAHGEIDVGSVGKRVAAHLWGETELAAHPSHAEWIRWIRGRLGVSQTELAKLLSTSQSRVGQWESGAAKPSPESIAKLKGLAQATPAP
jgi:DNA-binding transcriptional regulator YiaG